MAGDEQETETHEKKTFGFANYCVGFVDLLGQRDAMRGHQLLPSITTDEERDAFVASVRPSIGNIHRLQTRADEMLSTFMADPDASVFGRELSPDEMAVWIALNRSNIRWQRWSDGLICFARLGNGDVLSEVNGIFGVIALCGSLALLGLASGQPIRGGIEVAWGTELYAGELYGPAVARAYELESEVAQYPRIVVGPYLIGFLHHVLRESGATMAAQMDKSMAELCLKLLLRDCDGNSIIHYLGDSFRDAITEDQHADLYASSYAWICERLEYYREGRVSPLAFRYHQLRQYFEHFRPADGGKPA